MSEYIFETNIFEYSNIRIYSSHSVPHYNMSSATQSNSDTANRGRGIVGIVGIVHNYWSAGNFLRFSGQSSVSKSQVQV